MSMGEAARAATPLVGPALEPILTIVISVIGGLPKRRATVLVALPAILRMVNLLSMESARTAMIIV